MFIVLKRKNTYLNIKPIIRAEGVKMRKNKELVQNV